MADTTGALLREPVRVGGNFTETPMGAVATGQPGEPVESSDTNEHADENTPGAKSEIDYEECLSCQ